MITTSSPYNPPKPSDVWNTTDTFDARNRFYGLQVGARAAYDQGPWVGSVTGKLALGTMQQRVSVNGSLETNDYNDTGRRRSIPGVTSRSPTNSGDHSRDTFAIPVRSPRRRPLRVPQREQVRRLRSWRGERRRHDHVLRAQVVVLFTNLNRSRQ